MKTGHRDTSFLPRNCDQLFLHLRKLAIRLATLLLAPLPVAFAQIQDIDGGIRVFEPLYFQEFDPLTALDMVNRVPGVTPEESDGGRGLSGVKSNLLINGARPPPKGKSAREQLSQMPVDGVVLIELIDAVPDSISICKGIRRLSTL